MRAWTDYPLVELGDVKGEEAPIREVDVIGYDGDRYATVLVESLCVEIKAGYLYTEYGRYGEVSPVPIGSLTKFFKLIKAAQELRGGLYASDDPAKHEKALDQLWSALDQWSDPTPPSVTTKMNSNTRWSRSNQTMEKWIVTVCRIPTNYNPDTSYVVEAESGEDACAVVKHELRDLGSLCNYTYAVKPYEPPPPGKIVGNYD